MDPANWTGDLAPTAGSELLFPAGAPPDSLATINDFPDGTAFSGIHFAGFDFYSVVGNAITLGTGGLTSELVASIETPITLGASTIIQGEGGGFMNALGAIDTGPHTLTVVANANALVTLGPLSGTGKILKSGGGPAGVLVFGTGARRHDRHPGWCLRDNGRADADIAPGAGLFVASGTECTISSPGSGDGRSGQRRHVRGVEARVRAAPR